MPLKLVPPRKGKSPNWSIRGTYLKIYVDRSAGTDRRSVAAGVMRDLERRIERGEFPEKPADPGAPTFLSAAVAYLKARPPRTREKARRIGYLIRHFGETPIEEIDQAAIDKAAIEMYPDKSAVTRNAYVYMPTSAILHLAGSMAPVRRPKGFKGRTVTDYLSTNDAFAIIEAADRIDPEFGLMLRVLLYTGARIGEVLALRPEDVNPAERWAYVRHSKNGKPRTLRLREDLAAAMERHKPTPCGGRFFRFRQGGGFSYKLIRCKLAALGIPCPTRRPVGWREPPNRLHFANFHTFRHTWATWMRRYGGADIKGLVATGNWSSERAASRYQHVEAREEWSRVDRLPSAGGITVERAKKIG